MVSVVACDSDFYFHCAASLANNRYKTKLKFVIQTVRKATSQNKQRAERNRRQKRQWGSLLARTGTVENGDTSEIDKVQVTLGTGIVA